MSQGNVRAYLEVLRKYQDDSFTDSEISIRSDDVYSDESGNKYGTANILPDNLSQINLYRELYRGEQWNIDMLLDQLSYLIDEIYDVPEKINFYADYYLKTAQSICVSIESQNAYD